MPVALSWLQRSEELYQHTTRTGTKHAHLALALPLPTRGATAGDNAAAAATASSAQQQTEEPMTEEPQQPLEGRALQKPEEQLQPVQQPWLQPQQLEAQLEPGRPPDDKQQQQQLATKTRDSVIATFPTTAATADHSEAPEAGGQTAESVEGVGHGGSVDDRRLDSVEAGPPDPLLSSTAEESARGTEEHSAAGVEAAVSTAAADGPSSGPAAQLQDELPGNDSDAVQTQYTRTLYYLAQVHGHMKSSDRSALYCAATLYRQLASGRHI
jgi:hypothetical protein